LSQFEFIAVLVSIVTGLGVVRLLSGIAQFFSKGPKFYWVHLLWTWNVFHFIVFFWWFFWRWSGIAEWNILLFLFVLVYSVLMYLLCALLYPVGEDKTDFEVVYYEKRSWFFGLWVLVMIVDIVDTNWKAYYGMSGFGLFLATIWGLIIAGSVTAARTDNRHFHAAWAVIFFLIMSTIEFVNFSILRTD
jgi:hypothetical protein